MASIILLPNSLYETIGFESFTSCKAFTAILENLLKSLSLEVLINNFWDSPQSLIVAPRWILIADLILFGKSEI